MDKYNPDYHSIVHSHVPMVQVPVFKKVARLGSGQPNIVEFNSVMVYLHCAPESSD